MNWLTFDLISLFFLQLSHAIF